MSSIFEDLMLKNQIDKEPTSLNESVSSDKVTKEVKKFNVSKFKFESRKILEGKSAKELEEIDDQFAVDPESKEEGEVVLVIDPEVDAEDDIPEDAAEEAIGDLVYKCPVCGSNYLCDCNPELNEGVDVDENGVPRECPICGDDTEQILIGEIAPAENAPGEEKKELDSVEPDDAKDEEEIVDIEDEENLEESVKKRPSHKKRIKESPMSLDDLDDYSLSDIIENALARYNYDINIHDSTTSASIEEAKNAISEIYPDFKLDKFGDPIWKIPGKGIVRLYKSPSGNTYVDIEENYQESTKKPSHRKSKEESDKDDIKECDKIDKTLKESTDEAKKTISVAFDISVPKDTTEADIDKKLKDMFAGEDIGYIEVHEDLNETVDVHVADNGTATVTTTVPDEAQVTGCPDCGCEPCECEVAEGELEFDEGVFESTVNKHLDKTFKNSPRMKVESVVVKGNNLAINYSMTLGKKRTKGVLHCEGFDATKKVQSIVLKDKGIITESIGKESKFEAHAIIRKGHLRIF